MNVLLGEAVTCYVCNTGELYERSRCDSSSLDTALIKDCEVEGVKDNKNYTMCRKFIQDGKSAMRLLNSLVLLLDAMLVQYRPT